MLTFCFLARLQIPSPSRRPPSVLGRSLLSPESSTESLFGGEEVATFVLQSVHPFSSLPVRFCSSDPQNLILLPVVSLLVTGQEWNHRYSLRPGVTARSWILTSSNGSLRLWLRRGGLRTSRRWQDRTLPREAVYGRNCDDHGRGRRVRGSIWYR